MTFKMPESLEGLSVAEIATLIDGALDEFRTLALTDESSDDDLAAGEILVGHLNSLRERNVELEAAQTERASRLAAMNDATAPAAADEGETPEGDEGEGGEEAPAETPEVIVPDEVLTPEAVPASASPARRTQSPVQRAAASAPEVHVPNDTRTVSLVAAADVPGYANGQDLDDLTVVTAAVLARTRGLPKMNLATAQGGVRQRYGAAMIRKQGFGDLIQTKSQADDMDLVWRTGDQSRLEGGSLVAAGGWCAPSETMYDLCAYETVEGILDIPEFQVNRGGIRWTSGPSFDDIYTACGFEQTEAEAILGECKDCCSVECPDFEEVRLDAIGLCVKSPILTEHAYPELVRRFIEGALVAHQHKVNKYILDTMTLAAGAPVVAVDSGAVSVTLSTLELTGVGMRYAYRLSQTAPLEVVVPFWAKTVIRMDLAMQNNRDTHNVSDAEIDAWFSARNFAPQWVYDFQDPTVVACAVTIPTEFTVLMYPAGTWARGSADVINMDAVYDSPNLEANQYTALFIEEGILAVQRCTHTCAVTIPVCVSGKGVLDDLDVCLVAPALAVVPTTT